MKSIMLKVDDKIKEELDLIRSEEGLGTQTATITYLIKYYFLTKRSSLDTSIAILDKALDLIDFSKLPPAEEQLKDI